MPRRKHPIVIDDGKDFEIWALKLQVQDLSSALEFAWKQSSDKYREIPPTQPTKEALLQEISSLKKQLESAQAELHLYRTGQIKPEAGQGEA